MAEKPRRISVLPPEDDAMLLQALGRVSAAPAPAPAPVAESAEAAAPPARQPKASRPKAPRAAPPPPAPAVMETSAKKVTLSVRCSPATETDLVAIGARIGWSKNKIMTALVESQTRVLSQVFESEGVAGVLQMLQPTD